MRGGHIFNMYGTSHATYLLVLFSVDIFPFLVQWM